MKMRLDKFLANQGFGSRKEVHKLIKAGSVIVNDKIVKKPDLHIDPYADEIEVDGERIIFKENFYFMLNKPKGYITATYDENYPTVMDLFSAEAVVDKLFPVGRLDIDTEGLLIVTSDGQLAHRLAHPKWNIEKEYYAILEGDVSIVDFSEYEKNGIYFRKEKYRTKPFKVNVVRVENNNSEVYITLTEGKYHIVKRIMWEIGFPVKYLKRIRIGSLRLDEELEPGEYRELTEDEVNLLKNIVKMI